MIKSFLKWTGCNQIKNEVSKKINALLEYINTIGHDGGKNAKSKNINWNRIFKQI